MFAMLRLVPKMPVVDYRQFTTAETTTAAETTTEAETTTRAEYMLLNVVATAYCPCSECSGQYGRQTATGVTAAAGRTIAVDPSVIPYGTHVIINGFEYVAEDCGAAIKGNHIDIYYETHEEAEAFGRQQLQIKVMN